jgi:uncharacterized iron-regulated membrane protein
MAANPEHSNNNARRWRTLHRWLGWSVGLIFVLQGLSGSLLVVAEPLDAWLNPELAATAGNDPVLLQAADALEALHPGGVGMGVSRVDEAGKFLTAFWPGEDPLVPGERRYWLGRIHPADGSVLSARPYGAWPAHRHEAWVFLHAVHTSLTVGAVGKFFQIGVAALAFLLLASGVLNWRNRRRALRLRAPGSIRDSLAGRAHRTLGLGGAALLAVLLVSGIALQFETVLDSSFRIRSQEAGTQRLSLRAAWEAARKHFPDSETRLVMAPFIPGGAFRIDLIPSSGAQRGQVQELFIDAHSGRLIEIRNEDKRGALDRMIGALEPLHGGTILGTGGELLAFLCGLLPLGLLLSGHLNRGNRRQAHQR